MKLYFSPGACSLSPHIALREAQLPFELEQVNLRASQTKSGQPFRSINPKGAVPTLQLDDGQILTEGPAIVQYIADKKPESGLAPAAGTMERYRLVEWLNFISTELHKAFSPLFRPTTPEETKQSFREAIARQLGYAATQLEGRTFLLGDQFTVADAYLFTVLSWGRYVNLDIGQWPVLKAYFDRIAERPSVQAAMQAEGLNK